MNFKDLMKIIKMIMSKDFNCKDTGTCNKCKLKQVCDTIK